MRGRPILTCALLCGAAALVLPAIARADIGIQGPAYPVGTSGSPTTSKPESKLWWNDGFWWAVMFRSGEYRIFRLNLRAQTWSDTGVVVDTRDSTRQDVLSTGSKLFIASHKYVPVTNNTVPGANDEMRLLRFSYNAGTNRYASAPDGVSVIDPEKSETLVIDRDSTGALWATWVQTDGAHHVYVTKTAGDCVSGVFANCAWTAPPFELDNVSADDISSVVRVGNRVGVMWSNTTPVVGQIRFALNNGAVNNWSPTETVVGAANPKLADDHINLKADSAGRVYAVTKSKFTGESKPGTMLHRRSATGTWSTAVVSRASLDRTRPIVVLDPSHNAIRVFEGPTQGAAIFMKKSRLNSIAFPQLSAGTPVIRDDGSKVVNPTSTKQNVSNGTRLIVLATNNVKKRYWHAYQQIAPCINGGAGRNVLLGTNGNDALCGRGGNDTLRGFQGNDRLVGGAGRDKLVGGGGRDSFLAGGGNDTIISRDGFREILRGGPGHDRARVNRSDVRRSIEALF
jgi:Ca2+-binding RTX toxin-like protein